MIYPQRHKGSQPRISHYGSGHMSELYEKEMLWNT